MKKNQFITYISLAFVSLVLIAFVFLFSQDITPETKKTVKEIKLAK